jgi:hypothetical protein
MRGLLVALPLTPLSLSLNRFCLSSKVSFAEQVDRRDWEKNWCMCTVVGELGWEGTSTGPATQIMFRASLISISIFRSYNLI